MEQQTMPGRNGGTLNVGGSPGRPKGSISFKKTVQELLAMAGEDNVTVAEELARILIRQAAAGKVAAAKLIAQLTDSGEAAKIVQDGLSAEVTKIGSLLAASVSRINHAITPSAPAKKPISNPMKNKRKLIEAFGIEV